MSVDSRDVSLAVPARPDSLVLARLALAAVCRLTSLGPTEVADLKLAVTEAAGAFVAEDGRATQPGGDADDARLDFTFRLDDSRLVLEMAGPPVAARIAARIADQELGRAIIQATVDHAEFSADHVVLIKDL